MTNPNKGGLFFKDNLEIKGACAIGAAMSAYYGTPEKAVRQYEEKMSYRGLLPSQILKMGVIVDDDHIPAEWRDVKAQANNTLESYIIRLNDGMDVSREAIAEWIDTLIDQHGYDLYVEVDNPLSTEVNDGENADAHHPAPMVDSQGEPAPALG